MTREFNGDYVKLVLQSEHYWILIYVLFIRVQTILCLYLPKIWRTHACKNVKYPKYSLSFTLRKVQNVV